MEENSQENQTSTEITNQMIEIELSQYTSDCVIVINDGLPPEKEQRFAKIRKYNNNDYLQRVVNKSFRNEYKYEYTPASKIPVAKQTDMIREIIHLKNDITNDVNDELPDDVYDDYVVKILLFEKMKNFISSEMANKKNIILYITNAIFPIISTLVTYYLTK